MINFKLPLAADSMNKCNEHSYKNSDSKQLNNPA
jgi:hypothetical protein